MSMQWKNVKEDGPPTTEPLKQVKVLMYSDGWALPIMGMFSCHEAKMDTCGKWDVDGEWDEYSPFSGRYSYCDYLPEYYCVLTLPNGELA